MIILEGKLINIFKRPEGKTKDGTLYGGDDRIQIMHEQRLKDGSNRVDLIDLSVDDVKPYLEKINEIVRIPVAISVYQNKINMKAI